jgi:hypothetical protein
MACREGIDPADFFPGVPDPADEVAASLISIDDANAVKDPDNTLWVRFMVAVANINYTDDITFRYTTTNGTAIGGTHFTSASNILATIPAGEVEVEVEIPVTTGNFSGVKTFSVVLSSPSNATIDDDTGVATINFDNLLPDDPPDPPDPTDPLDLPSFLGWSEAQRVTYDQFPGCQHDASCTGYAGAAVMTALAAKRGLGKWRFDPKKLFLDAGGRDCLDGDGDCNHALCPGENPAKIINWMRSTGVRRIDTNPVSIGGVNYSCAYRDVTSDHDMFKIGPPAELGGGGKTVNQVINAVKTAIYTHGAVYMSSIFYSNWNDCRGAENHILRPHGNDNSSLGHAWALVGWDNSVLVPNVASMGSLAGERVGCFRIQSSHGCDWGVSGRGWIPYSYLRANWPSGSNAPRYRYWRLTWGGAA